ncbi:myo-inositol 2-dehydrogenase/D-chiro-inositol 1-dehydrogenase [Knoellia remsis]|uniref:Myo-inositol 2-dehydrogenase/D-chiro-inositol 1-dehydrogenase n=1 Tax=Knoellia remsis TaxID=407159 RepID=A0A2T0ULN6_9MICO|nr:Gfo/Idh/MocA family oxidoreductase [Knoellia remsis]PRY58804.1 myo-inositol 2-dehydrogenase/D-chiro-inositol 1-dehydrogenase [Knoellia remsis]
MRIGLAGVGRIGAFHASTLAGLDAVDEVVVADLDAGLARRVAADQGLAVEGDLDALLARDDLDGFVITTATTARAELLRRTVAAGIPTFCEKPVAATLPETIELTTIVESAGVPVHVGFQRRFDVGYRRAREAVASGELGVVHAIRALTHDQEPPHAAYVPTSGGIFRDCSVHDFDIVRFVTGQEVATVSATGANKGAAFFGEAGDVDTAAAILTLDDDTLVTATATRYSGGGHDVRMEVMGSVASVAVGLDASLALRSAEEGVTFPTGPVHANFMQRFRAAYVAELTAFCDVAAGRVASPCTVRDALQAFRVAEACEISRAEGRPVALAEVADAPVADAPAADAALGSAV